MPYRGHFLWDVESLVEERLRFGDAVVIELAAEVVGEDGLHAPAVRGDDGVESEAKGNVADNQVVVAQIYGNAYPPIRAGAEKAPVVGCQQSGIDKGGQGGAEAFFDEGQESGGGKGKGKFLAAAKGVGGETADVTVFHVKVVGRVTADTTDVTRIVVKTATQASHGEKGTDVLGAEFQHAAFETAHIHVRTQCGTESIVAFRIAVEVRIAHFTGEVSVIAVFAPLESARQAQIQTGRDVFGTPEVVNQVGFVVFQFRVDQRIKGVDAVVIQMVGVPADKRAVVEKRGEKTSREIQVAVVPGKSPPPERVSQPQKREK